MRVELIEPFLRAAYSCLESLVQDTPERGALAIRETTFTTQQVTIVAGVNGDVEGTVLYGMSLITAQKIAAGMMGMPLKEMDDMAWSAISELGNIITGNAVNLIHQSGFTCDITPPSILRGMNMQVSTHVPALVVPMITKFGRLEINVALSEAMAKAA